MYTKEEIAIIKNNLGKIQEWVSSNIVPQLRKYENVSIDFGEWKTYPRSFVKEQEHSFTVNGDGEISYRSGGLFLSFNSKIVNDRNIYDSWPYTLDLFKYWDEVKMKLNAATQKKDRERANLLSFEV